MPGARHRDAGALERRSPATADADEGGARRIVVSTPPTASSNVARSTSTTNSTIPRDVLIVASKLKDYIRARSDMNTSGDVMEALSDYVRFRCDEAIDNARREGRKTVMERDFKR